MATILIVDDHVLNREFLTTLLGYGGHRLMEAPDGIEALKAMRQERPALVIADILMPNMDGFEFVNCLKADPAIADVPVIFYTATYREREARVMAAACGVRWVLPKPSDPEVILKTVHEALGMPPHAPLSLAAGCPALAHAQRGKAAADIGAQLSAFLADVESSSGLFMQLATGNPTPTCPGEDIGLVAKRLSTSLSALQAVSLRLTALIDLGIELASVRDPAQLLEIGCRVAHDICVAKYAVIGVVSAEHEMTSQIATRGLDPVTLANMGTSGAREGVLARLLDGQSPMRLTGLSGKPALLGLRASHPPVHSFLGVAIESNRRVHGWLYLVDKLGAHEFSEVDERVVATVAAQLAVAFENLNLYERIQHSHQQLQTEMGDRIGAQKALGVTLLARNVMIRCNQILVRATNETAMLQQMCDAVVEIGGYRTAWICYPDSTDRPVAAAHAGPGRTIGLDAAPEQAVDECGWHLAAQVLQTGTPCLAGHSPAAPQEAAAGQNNAPILSLPLTDDDRIIGALTICANASQQFDADQVALFAELSGDIAYGVANLRHKAARGLAEHNLSLAEDKLSGILNSIDNIVWSWSGSELLYLSQAVERIYGRTASAFHADHELWFKVIHCDDLARVRNRRARLVDQNTLVQEFRILRPDGEIHWIEARINTVRDKNGKLLRFDGVEIDITARKAYEAQFIHMANHDALTGLANRNLLSDRLTQAILHSRRTNRLLALLFLDLDRFKEINDNGGHALGDLLLKEVALRLKYAIRVDDTVARQGGDEFIILLANLHEQHEVDEVVGKVLAVFDEPFLVEGQKLIIAASIGVTVFPDDSEDATTLLRYADTAMYRAKEQAGSSFQFYSKEMSVRSAERAELERKLRHACEHEEFEVFYQSKVDITTERIIGAEALLRWRQPDGSMISPAVFIPVAEEIGLIVRIGEWVLRTACLQNKAWHDAGLGPLCVAVNLSASQFLQVGLTESVERALRESGLDPCHLELELTESTMMNSAEHFILTLHALKSLGVQLSIDDFGTGYSSLSYLKRFPIDRLKIDQSFVRDLATDQDDATITCAVIALGHALDLKVIAEGVETREQLLFLRANGCDEIQGYYFSKPMPASAFGALLERARKDDAGMA
jgi:diguanylate cyclase (GGDEF)-like protein/PAS domain S-box-containing protein